MSNLNLRHMTLAFAFAGLSLLPACTSAPSDISMIKPSTLETHQFQSFDGATISYQTVGNGPPVLLLHGFTVNADVNWLQTGIANKIANAGYTVIAPDTRGHGGSANLASSLSWPEDAAAHDQIALMAHLNAEPYAVVGYSMGSLIALRYHLLSQQGSRLVLGGVGDSAADETNTDRNDAFGAAIRAAMGGSEGPAATAMRARAKATGSSLENYLGALSSRTYTNADVLKTFDVPTLVITGDQDNDNGSGAELAKIIPGARYQQVIGTHQSAVGDPALPEAIITFLNEGR